MATASNGDSRTANGAESTLGSTAESAVPQIVSQYARVFSVPGEDAPQWGELNSEQQRQVRRHGQVGQQRAPGQSRIAVDATEGSSVELWLVNDDLPLLVDAVIGALESSGLTVDEVDHPVLSVIRDRDGHIVDDAVAGGEGTTTTIESWIHATASASTEPDAAALSTRISDVTQRVAHVHSDGAAMAAVFTEMAAHYRRQPDLAESANLLDWLGNRHFRPYGCVGRTVDGKHDPSVTSLGIWRDNPAGVRGEVSALAPMRVGGEPLAFEQIYLPITASRSNYPSVIRMAQLSDDGTPVGEIVVVGIFTATALHESVFDVPLVRDKAREVLRQAQVEGSSYTGAAMTELMQTLPRLELLASSATELVSMLSEVLYAVPRRELRAFLRSDPNGSIVSALVYLPRDRYTTRLRLLLQETLLSELDGQDLQYTARVSESALAQLHVLFRSDAPPTEGRADGAFQVGSPTQLRVQQILTDAVRSWDDEVRMAAQGSEVSSSVLAHYATALPDGYKEQRTAQAALADIREVEALGADAFSVRLADAAVDASGERTVTMSLYLSSGSAALSDVLPVLHSLGMQVLDERPYEFVRTDGMRCWLYEFGLRPMPGYAVDEAAVATLHDRFTEAFGQVWVGNAEIDDFNRLILRCGLTWRQAAVLRAYSRYLAQCGFAYSPAHMADLLGDHPEFTAVLIELFEASFSPTGAEENRRHQAWARAQELLGDIISLDTDRVLGALVSVVLATVRTNYYLDDPVRSVLAFKLRPGEIPQAPQPRPEFEIFVHSPEVEGVHLRFGSVARGGLRWSDRREDFRTEILGLVKAQAVKNAVIVPVGAKGGFVTRRSPRPTGDAAADREAFRNNGIRCYRSFISALLDVTDNLDQSTFEVTAPTNVVRRDGDDPYLVVAADKGTAAFSDIANDVAAQYKFWLGDAFASGGSVGYDHKAMGITARGAWEAVKRHFRERDHDTQTDDFTVVGVGDMSGDVFGNGMLLSRHIRLVAAFDHRHVFIDPNPDAATSFVERQRLFDMPRSSWDDYDRTLISAGGGVWSREQKSIAVSPQARAALGIDDDRDEMSPPELIRAILLTPVDLLWNGGIGTYIKASTESNDEVGDKANDPIRVNGNQLRAKVVGEGGNLGATARGRIEFDRSGGAINTDAMDNSAGVDCSDHEVNIKILLDAQVAAGALDAADRSRLLESMTDEVARLVLHDNISQNNELGYGRATAVGQQLVYSRLLGSLRSEGVDLELEALPTPQQLLRRGDGLSSPELATVMAHVKLMAKQDLLGSDLPDNDLFAGRLSDYFPAPLRTRFADGITSHRLRREIVATSLINDVVDRAGMTHLFRMFEGTASHTTDIVRAYVVATGVFGLDELWQRISAEPCAISAVNDMTEYVRRLLFRSSRWLLANRPQPLPLAAELARYHSRVAALTTAFGAMVAPDSRSDIDAFAARLESSGVSRQLASDVAVSVHRFCLLDIVDVADITERDDVEVGQVYFALMQNLGIEGLLSAVSDLDHGDRWNALARLALRDDLHGALRSLTLAVVNNSVSEESVDEKLADWEQSRASQMSRVRSTLDEIAESGSRDLATLSVAARGIRSVIR